MDDAKSEETSADNAALPPIHVGTMGWSYEDWYGPFYPKSVASRDALTHYARVFDSVEIDSTFYGTPPETSVRNWQRAAPEGFLFAPKVPRSFTHDAKLKDVEEPFREYVQRMTQLGPKLGPILIQLPPDFTRADLPALQAFLPLLQQFQQPQVRFAIEFRHRSLIGPDISELLTEHKVALVAVDFVNMPRRFELTADFVYVRIIGRHGAFEHHRHAQADRLPDLQKWAEALRRNREKYQEAFVFCNDDFEGHAPVTANSLKALLGQTVVERPPETQGTLF